MNLNTPPFHPIFFPTKVAIIDDDPDYLTQISTCLNNDLACELFTSPLQALKEIRSYSEKNIGFIKDCAYHANLENDDNTKVDEKDIYRFIDDEHRFNRYSVLLIDYAMPEMNGLELCKRIQELCVKKVLITGKADLAVAVQALNEGVIDYFIQKQEDNVENHLNAAIRKLSRRYFNDICAIKNINLEKTAPYLFDQYFSDWFNSLCRENDIVEYYLKRKVLVSEFLLVNKTGDIKFLFVQTPDQARAQFEIAMDFEGLMPGRLFQAICNRDVILHFPGDCVYDASFKDSWEKYVYPAERFNDYVYALVDAQNLPEFGVEHVACSYDRFLQNFCSDIKPN